MASVPAKIVLKSTTKCTLSDRFTQIQKMRPAPSSPQEVRVQMAASQQSSQQNRRLAQQMANRPAVQAALGQRMAMPKQPMQQTRSLKQRLGPTNVKARLSMDMPTFRGRGRGFRRGGSGFRGRGQQNGYVSGGMVYRGDNRGGYRGQNFSNRGRGGFSPRWLDDRRPRGRGGFGRQGDASFRGGYRGFRGQRGGNRGFIRGQRGAPRGRGRGGRGQRGGPNQGMSREQLDNQLEEYMSKTKSHLDQELDQYMAEATS